MNRSLIAALALSSVTVAELPARADAPRPSTNAQGPLSPGPLRLDGRTLLAQADAPPPPPPGYEQQQPPPGDGQPPPGYVQPPPPGYYQQPLVYQQPPQHQVTMEYTPRWGLFAAGLTVFAVGYLPNVAGTYAFTDRPDHVKAESLIPVAGPLMQCGDSYSNATERDVARFFLVWDFVVQTAGLAMTAASLVFWHKVATYSEAEPTLPHNLRFAAGPSRNGVGVTTSLALDF